MMKNINQIIDILDSQLDATSNCITAGDRIQYGSDLDSKSISKDIAKLIFGAQQDYLVMMSVRNALKELQNSNEGL